MTPPSESLSDPFWTALEAFMFRHGVRAAVEIAEVDALRDAALPQPADGCSSNEGADGWIEWSGGENPAGGSVLDIRFRDGTTGCWNADEPSWRDFWLHRAGGNDIIAYRILPQTEKGS